MQGALADTFFRFPLIGKAALYMFSPIINRIIADTKINEKYSIELVKRRIKKNTSRKDFYTRILEHRGEEALSDVQLAAHASDFVLAGSETSSTCLSTITYYLLRNPEIMERLQNEVRMTFTTYKDIHAASTVPLKYMNAVILEGLRIHPPLPFSLPRLVPKGGDSVDGHWLPEGTVVSTSPIGASLDPSNFKDPFRFKPERWLSTTTKDDLAASQPFSMGPRGCIGRSLGWMEMRTALAKLLWTYDLTLLDNKRDWFNDSRMHTLWQKPSIQVQVKKRPLADKVIG